MVKECWFCKEMGVDKKCTNKNGETVPACKDCYNELVHGKIKNMNVHFIGCSTARPEDGESPWQQNALRILEG